MGVELAAHMMPCMICNQNSAYSTRVFLPSLQVGRPLGEPGRGLFFFFFLFFCPQKFVLLFIFLLNNFVLLLHNTSFMSLSLLTWGHYLASQQWQMIYPGFPMPLYRSGGTDLFSVCFVMQTMLLCLEFCLGGAFTCVSLSLFCLLCLCQESWKSLFSVGSQAIPPVPLCYLYGKLQIWVLPSCVRW